MRPLFIFLIFTTTILLGQTPDRNEKSDLQTEVSILELLEKAIISNGDTIVLDSKVILTPGKSNPLFGDEHYDELLRTKFQGDNRLQIENNRIVIRTNIILDKCKIDKNLWIWLRNFEFKGLFSILNHSDNVKIYLDNVILHQGFRLFTLPGKLEGNIDKKCELTFSNCQIKERLYCGYGVTNLLIDSTTFSLPQTSKRKRTFFKGSWDMFPISDTLTTTRSGTIQDIRKLASIYLGNAEIVTIQNSTFEHSQAGYLLFNISGSTNTLILKNNTINQYLNLGIIVNNKVVIEENRFDKGGLDISNLTIPQKIKIRWPQLAGNKLMLLEDQSEAAGIYFGNTQSELLNQDLFTDLTKSYQSLLNIFKLHGDQVSINGCFSELKDIQGEYYKSLYIKSGGFKNYFSWKINRLLKFYSNHGTDPALAIVISIYIILAFSIIYFFFPSDWDITSKSKLIANFRDFVTKNDKGYFKPLLKVILGFTISLTNSITLSLNAFTTLGFGNIPTHGLARYICIVQGFIGWFLLSIFTVALINQVSI